MSIGSHTVPRRTPGSASNVVPIGESRTHCAYCGMRELCLPAGLAATEIEDLHGILGKRVKVLKEKLVKVRAQHATQRHGGERQPGHHKADGHAGQNSVA